MWSAFVLTVEGKIHRLENVSSFQEALDFVNDIGGKAYMTISWIGHL